MKKITHNNLEEFLSHFHLKIKNFSFYFQAFTHPSFLKKRKIKKSQESGRKANYQELEFLGDSIIQFLTSSYLYNKYPNLAAGQLTLLRSKLVCTKNLNQLTINLDLKKYIKTQHGNIAQEIIKSSKVGADIFESLVGALYLDLGLIAVKKFLNQTLFTLDELILKDEKLKDEKTRFQEYIQSFSKNAVHYHTIAIENHQFYSTAYVENKKFGVGIGHSKNAAEVEAAKNALTKLKVKNI